MERAGFIGMRRNIHFLVKNSPPAQTNIERPHPPKGPLPTSDHSMGDEDLKAAFERSQKLAEMRGNIEGYLQSCGAAMFQGGMSPAKVEQLVDQSDDVSVRDEFGWTLLHYAANSRLLMSA